jgi:LemA protein
VSLGAGEAVILIVILLIAMPVIGLVISYNRFISQRTLIETAWANIDTELRRRYDLIPNLVETVKGYAAHEQGVLESVTRARAAAVASTGSPQTQAADEGALVGALRQLLAVSESYPDLKADQRFGQLQEELANTENRIQVARRLYNTNVNQFNRRIDAFPSNLVAGWFKFAKREFFEVDEAIRDAGPPAVDFS